MDLVEKNQNTNRHPWELSRTDAILRELEKLNIRGDILDIGCGDHFFDHELVKKNNQIKSLWGVDINAKESIVTTGKEHYVNSYDELRDTKFDFILLMDVMEHIEDDILFLKELKKYQKDSTVLFITVPAFQWLFSLHDKELHHYRRYDIKCLKEHLDKAGYTILDWSYFYLSLIILRILTKNKTQNLSMWEKTEKSMVTKLVRGILNLDYYIIRTLSRMGFHIGGLSLMAICKYELKEEL